MEYWGMVARNIHSVALVMAPMSWLIVMFSYIELRGTSPAPASWEAERKALWEAERKALRPFRWMLLIPPLSTLAYVLTPAW